GSRISADRIAGKAHFRCLRAPYCPRQKPGTTIAGDQAQLDEAFGKGCLFRGDAHVAHQGDVTTGTVGRPVDGSNGWHPQIVQSQRNALDVALVVGADLGRTTAKDIALVLHVLDVATGTEGRTGTREDHYLDIVFAVDLLHGPLEAVDHVFVDGVAHVRTIHGENRNIVFGKLEFQRRIHDALE